MHTLAYVAPFLTLAAAYSLMYVVRLIVARRAARRRPRDSEADVAALRLRLPKDAQLVTLEHQIYFYDPRNRDAAAVALSESGFTVTATETYGKPARYWLLAVRTVVVERAPEETVKVARFAASYSGRYVERAARI